MKLEIVWRNPLPLPRSDRNVQRIRSDQFGTVYAVTDRYLTQEFDLISGDAA